jgi:regulator of nucleoside diphosphate kinase
MEQTKEIVVTKVDYLRLNSLILNLLEESSHNIHELNYLNMEIKRATKIDSRKIAPDFVTMDSIIEVTFVEFKKTRELKLVYPHKANFKEGLVSVLSPLGCALLGFKAGDIVTYKSPGGIQSVRIDKVIFQPEANGEDLQ